MTNCYRQMRLWFLIPHMRAKKQHETTSNSTQACSVVTGFQLHIVGISPLYHKCLMQLLFLQTHYLFMKRKLMHTKQQLSLIGIILQLIIAVRSQLEIHS